MKETGWTILGMVGVYEGTILEMYMKDNGLMTSGMVMEQCDGWPPMSHTLVCGKMECRWANCVLCG